MPDTPTLQNIFEAVANLIFLIILYVIKRSTDRALISNGSSHSPTDPEMEKKVTSLRLEVSELVDTVERWKKGRKQPVEAPGQLTRREAKRLLRERRNS